MLNRALFYFLGAAILSGATFLITRIVIIKFAPVVVMSSLEDRIASGAGGWNACFHNQTYGPRPNAARRANSDSIISAMAYDLRDGPVRIAGEVSPRYWSISFYQQNSDNFFVMNDLEIESPTFEFMLAIDEDDTASFEGTAIISPSTKGIMLIRRFAADASDMPGVIGNQKSLVCAKA